jgi:hypothetical protein
MGLEPNARRTGDLGNPSPESRTARSRRIGLIFVEDILREEIGSRLDYWNPIPHRGLAAREPKSQRPSHTGRPGRGSPRPRCRGIPPRRLEPRVGPGWPQGRRGVRPRKRDGHEDRGDLPGNGPRLRSVIRLGSLTLRRRQSCRVLTMQLGVDGAVPHEEPDRWVVAKGLLNRHRDQLTVCAQLLEEAWIVG